MSMDDCFIPTRSPPRECAPPLDASWGSYPCLSQLDLGERAAAQSGKPGGGGSHGETAVYRRTLHILNRPIAVPPRRFMAPLGPMPKISRQPPHMQTPSYKDNLPDEPKQQNASQLPDEPKQHRASQVTVSRTAPRGRRSRADWASKERSTPEDMNLEQHAWRFRFTFPQPVGVKSCYGSDPESDSDFDPEQPPSVPPPPPMMKKESMEERNALRQQRIAARQSDSLVHAELALRKYNGANNTTYELVEVQVMNVFFEFGRCYHYNFTAKPADDGGSMKLFFSEVGYNVPQTEKDILHCCIVVENDAGHCHGCKEVQPTLIHPTSGGYGGGSCTLINYPPTDSDSDDNYD